MKKTVSVNIKGTNFLIEEDAYELLQDYLDRLAQALKNDEGSKEIIEDVELRIAEICSSKLSDLKTVIELKDIEDILAALGNPADFVDEDEESNHTIPNADSKHSIKENNRRLFRDTDSATIGGVCAGISNYFGIDVVIIRAIFVVLFLFAGFGFPLYLILWIIIPKAESTIDKLRMKGRPITVESVKKEVEDAAEKLKAGSKSFAGKLRDDGSYKKRVSRGGRILAIIFGLWMIGIGLVSLIGFLIFIVTGFEIIPIHGENGYMPITDLGELVLSNPEDVGTAWIGGLMVWVSGMLFLFFAGSLILLKIRNKWSKLVLGALVLVGIIGAIICATVAFNTARDFTIEGEIERIVGTSNRQELVVVPRLQKYNQSGDFNVKSEGHILDLEIERDRIKSYGIEIEYVTSSDTAFHILQNLSANGKTHKKALTKSKNIVHNMELINDTLYVDVEYSYPIEDKFRLQDVKIIIKIPEGRSVRMDNRTIHLGEGSKNTTIDHPYYREQGKIRSDGSYDHYFN